MKSWLDMYAVHRIIYKMRFEGEFYLSIDGPYKFDAVENRAFVLRGGSRGLSSIRITENGTVLETISVSLLPFHRWKASFYIPPSQEFKRILTISGLSKDGSVLTQTERIIRQIPTNRLVLHQYRYFWDWHYEFRWEWDFTFSKYTRLYTVSGLEKDGWSVSPENKLVVTSSKKYF